MIKTRRATQQDHQLIHKYKTQLQQHLYRSNPSTWRRDPESQEFNEEVTQEIQNHTLIATVDKQPAGYISAKTSTRNQKPTRVGMILNLYIDLRHRRKGVATTLVRDTLNYFNKEKVEEITLRYQIGNKEAEEFWTRLGFQPIITTENTTPEKLKENLRK